MIYRRSVHFLKPGTESDFQCGGHTGTKARPDNGSDVTADPWLVDCARCQASDVVKAASQAKNEAIRANEEAIESAGFDPNKPLSEMTREEVLAFIAWREAQED